MTLEWLRRHDPKLDEHLRTYLFTTGSILADRGRGRARRAAAGHPSGRRQPRHRQPARATPTPSSPPRSADEPPAARAGADLRRRLGGDRRGGHPHAHPLLRGAQARRLRGPARLRRLGRQPRPPAARSATSRPTGSRPTAASCCRSSSCAAGSRCRASELESIDRGADDPDLDPVVDACRALAMAEDTLVFVGNPSADIVGIGTASPHTPIALTDDFDQVPERRRPGRRPAQGGRHRRPVRHRPRAALLRRASSRRPRRAAIPLLQHLGLILGGPVVWAPAVDGAIVLSERGGDFTLTVGQDASIAYKTHDADDRHPGAAGDGDVRRADARRGDRPALPGLSRAQLLIADHGLSRKGRPSRWTSRSGSS